MLNAIEQQTSTIKEAIQTFTASPYSLSIGSFTARKRIPEQPQGLQFCRPPSLTWQPAATEAAPEALRQLIDAGDVANRVGGIESAKLPFCVDCTLWHLWFPAERIELPTDADAFVITSPHLPEPLVLNWTNQPIYELCDKRLFRLSRDFRTYAKCFFFLVRGELGSFIILESPSDIDSLVTWKHEATSEVIAEQRALMAGFIEPMRNVGLNSAGETALRSTVMFRNALFRANVMVMPNGQLRLDNEELLCENLAIAGAAESEDEEKDE
jgi:hypothetical protein